MKSLFAALGVAVFVVFCIVALPTGTSTHRDGRMSSSSSEATDVDASSRGGESRGAEAVHVNAVDYANEYHRNEVPADEKYKGHRVAITGVVTEIRKDYADNAYVEMLAPGTLFGGVHAKFGDSTAHTAAALTPNSLVTLVCTGEGMFMEKPFLKDCGIQQQLQKALPSIETSSSEAEDSRETPLRAQVERPATMDGDPDQSNDLRRHYVDGVYGYQFDYPASYRVITRTTSPNSVVIKSPDGSVSLVAIGSSASDHTVAEAYALERELIHSTPTYEAKGKSWVVMSWRDGGKAYYLKRFIGASSQNTFIINFPEEQLAEDSFLPTMVERSFRPGDLIEAH